MVSFENRDFFDKEMDCSPSMHGWGAGYE